MKEQENENIKKNEAKLFLKVEADLGESPLWLPSSNELIWVDINKGQVHCLNVNSKKDKILYQGKKTTCVFPLSEIDFIIADTDNLIKFNKKTSTEQPFLKINFKDSNIRFNDGKIDPNGNLWIGTMDMNVTPNKGSLYRIDSEKNVSEELKEVTISNGLAWSLDAKTMYYIDTFESVVYAFDFNDKSELSNQRIIIKIPKEFGAPDGMTIDSVGNLWVAMWGGFSVICWNPNSGKLVERINVAAPNVTSCAFGGKYMNTLFITTAREGLSASELELYPNSGSVFQVETEVEGSKLYSYK
jgi:sugar lactone lactonase YvrE